MSEFSELRAGLTQTRASADRAERKSRAHDNDLRTLHTMIDNLRKDVRGLIKTVGELPKKIDVEAVKSRATTLERRMGDVEDTVKRLNFRAK